MGIHAGQIVLSSQGGVPERGKYRGEERRENSGDLQKSLLYYACM